MLIREVESDGELADADAVLAAIGRGDTPTVAQALEWGRKNGYITRYWAASDRGGPVLGAAALSRLGWRPPGVFSVHVAVVPEHRRHGIGAALYAAALSALRDMGAARAWAEADGQDEDAVAFARRRGFAVTQQFRTMVLDVPSFDESAHASLAANAAVAGIRITSFAEAGDTAENRARLYELNRRLAADIPGNADDFPSFDEYVCEIIEADWFSPEGQLIAAHGERWIGLAGVGYDAERRRASHEFTAIDPAERGKGVGQALKLASIRYARALGAVELTTGNDALNDAMLAINRKLGYAERLGVTRLELVLDRAG